MPEDFNRELFFGNLYYLIRKQDIKIGEIESGAGVSAGYISRASRDEKSKPGVEFVMKAAELLHISIDALLRADLASTTPSEEYIMSFLTKLNSDTLDDKLEWVRESTEELNRLSEENEEHPLFSEHTFKVPTDDGVDVVTEVVFVSHNFGCQTTVNSDCYKLRMKNGTLLFLMNIFKTYSSVSNPNNLAIEVWMASRESEPQYLCDNKGETAVSSLVDGLYTAVSENMRSPKISGDFRYAIDAFMQHDDLEDDPPPFDPDDIPF